MTGTPQKEKAAPGEVAAQSNASPQVKKAYSDCTHAIAGQVQTASHTAFDFDTRDVPVPQAERPEDGMRRAMVAVGMTPPDEFIADGTIQRFSLTGKRGDKSGWYILHGDGIPAGSFGDWRTGHQQNWCSNEVSRMTAAERAAYETRITEARKKHNEEQVKARQEAQKLVQTRWQAASSDGSSAYLQAKGVGAHGVRFEGDLLLVPLRDEYGQIHSLQTIYPDGKKRYQQDGRKQGCFHVIGPTDGPIVVCEGYATGASIYEATGLSVAVAFDAGGLEPTAKALRRAYPSRQIVLAADDDWKTNNNPGLSKAKQASQAVGGVVVSPSFGEGRGEKDTDFNDLARSAGLLSVRDIFTASGVAPRGDGGETTSGAVDSSDLAGFHILEMPDGIKATEFVVDGFLPNGVTVISGAPGAGKTTNLVPMAASVAHLIPKEWGFHPKRRRIVVWLSEHPEQVIDTIEAILREPGAAPREEWRQWFKVVTTKRSSPQELADLIAAVNARFSWQNERGVWIRPLIVWDTAAATIDVDNENDNTVISKAISTAKRVLDGGALWVIHHTPKADKDADSVQAMSARGGGAFEGDANCTAYLFTDKQTGCRVLGLGKVRFSPEFSEVHFSTARHTETIVDEFDGQALDKTVTAGIPSMGSKEGRQQEKKDSHKQGQMDAILQAAVEAANKGEVCSGNQLIQWVRESSGKSIGNGQREELLDRMKANGMLRAVDIPEEVRRHLKIKGPRVPALLPVNVDPETVFRMALQRPIVPDSGRNCEPDFVKSGGRAQ